MKYLLALGKLGNSQFLYRLQYSRPLWPPGLRFFLWLLVLGVQLCDAVYILLISTIFLQRHSLSNHWCATVRFAKTTRNEEHPTIGKTITSRCALLVLILALLVHWCLGTIDDPAIPEGANDKCPALACGDEESTRLLIHKEDDSFRVPNRVCNGFWWLRPVQNVSKVMV
jgi:hypothetical protein